MVGLPLAAVRPKVVPAGIVSNVVAVGIGRKVGFPCHRQHIKPDYDCQTAPVKVALQVEVGRITRVPGRRSVAGVLAAAVGAVDRPNEEEEQRKSRISRPLIFTRLLSTQLKRSRSRLERKSFLHTDRAVKTHH